MKRLAFAAVTLLTPISMGIPSAGAGEEQQAWKLLLANKTKEAKAAFEKPGAAAPIANLARLEGRLACAHMRGDLAGAWDIAREQAWISAPLPGGLGQFFFVRVRRLAASTRKRAALVELAGSLLSEKKTHPAVRRLALDVALAAARRRRDWARMDTLEKQDGYIRLYAAVMGPFRTPTEFQLDAIEEPESSPGKASYIDRAGGAVQVRKNVAADRNGDLGLYRLLPSTHLPAAAYAVALLKSNRERRVVLSFRAGGEFKAWLRGVPVFRTDAYKFEYRKNTREVRVRLLAGINPLMLKSRAWSGYAVRVLDPDGGVANDVVCVKYDAKSLRPVRPMLGFVASSRHRPQLLETLEKLQAPLTPKLLWLARTYEQVRDIARARRIWDSFLQGNPKSLYLLTAAAQERMRESRMGIDARNRLVKEALDLLHRALKIDPACCPALLLMGSHYQRNRQTDQAIELLRRALKSCPAAAGAHQLLARIYAKKKWHALAEAEYKQLLPLGKDWDLALADFYRKTGRNQEANRILDRAWKEKRIDWRRRMRSLMRRGKWPDATRLLEEWHAANPVRERRYLTWRLDIATRSGDEKAQAECLRRQLEIDPQDPKPALKLAELRLRQDQQQEARKWLRRADAIKAAKDDIDLDLRYRLRKLEGRRWELLGYDLALKDLHARKVKKADHPRANYAVILNLQVHRIYPDRSVESLLHTAIKVLDKQGVGALAELTVPQGSDNLLFCRTVQPDGSVFVPTSAENLQLGKAASMYNVKSGSVLEYAYRKTASGGRTASFTDEFQVERFNIPVMRGRYVIILPKRMRPQLSIKVHPRDLAPEVREQGEELVYIWDFRDRKGVKPETFLPGDEPTLAHISIAVRKLDFGWQTWSRKREAPMRSSREIERQAMKLAGQEPDDARKARRVYSWIATTIKDAAGATTARDCFRLKSGDSEAKARLCRAMLHALGIESHFAKANPWLSRAGRGSRRVRARLASGFGQELLHVLLPEAPDLWFKFQRPARNFRPDDIGYRLTGAPALETDGGGTHLVTVRGEDDENVVEHDILTVLQEDGSAAVKATLTFFGSLAGRMRTVAEQPQRGPRYMERLAAQFFPKINLDESDYPHGEEQAPSSLPARQPFIFRFRGRVKRFCHPEGKGFSFSPFLDQSLNARRLIAPLPRENPYDLPSDHVMRQRFTFVAPKGWCFSAVPADCHWSTRFGLFVLDFNVQGDRLTASRLLIIPTQKLTAEEYPALARWLGEIEKVDKPAVSLRRLPVQQQDEVAAVYHQGAINIANLASFQPRYWYQERPTPAAGTAKPQPVKPADKVKTATRGGKRGAKKSRAGRRRRDSRRRRRR